ncbi:calcineurin-like phosphoesterase C-terminal domain-containing protein [Pedobacter xixiisoli]|uniref:3',5'-cyclic AMP phosphodiesterase CpdA n=1 Tax=Pedobacter xixiisoli TaxID=1476464 RepID=A0A285ZQR3_9SPHI|nr:calcineurin-like phosphoesterase family protein [Pedobacter xixiisoli]SOD12013.1 3',5'-cyclic AMP phosphodiesterase CpdA [Pedobacter xixiisoli]
MKDRISTISLLASLFLLIQIPQIGYAIDKGIIVKGQVFYDANRNGIHEAKEKGLKNILISNGKDIVKTDKNGLYTIEANIGESIFPILPSEYTWSKSKSKVVNANYLYLDPNQAVIKDTISWYVPVFKSEAANSFSFGAIGDIQVDNTEELNYAAKSIFSELNHRNDIRFNLMLGDIVNDKVELLPMMHDMMNQLPSSSWTLVGNHDRNVDNPLFMNDAFNRVNGSDNYSFNYGKAHFIVLNNIFATDKKSYEGRLTAKQLQFLKNDLSYVSKEKTIVISQHIPMVATKNKQEILDLLKDYAKVLILSGHTHTVSRHFFNYPNIQELGVGATCGNWWRGEKNTDGVPSALMQCGTPRGYFVINFDDDKYNFRYKGVGLDATKQMTLTTDSNRMVINVFGGGDSTTVSIKIDDGKWVKMNHKREIDPTVLKIVELNQSKVYPTQGNTANPLRKRYSSHIWELTRPTTSASPKKTVVLVKAQDRFGLNVEEKFLLYEQ